MSEKVKWKPDGYHSATPYLIVRGGAAAIDFYKRAFGAAEMLRVPGPGGKIMHAEVKIGDSIIMLADEFPEMNKLSPPGIGGSPVILALYVEDVDAIVHQAIEAGATVESPVRDQFYGDRSGTVIDPFGHAWTIATHIEDVSPEELARRMEGMNQQTSA
jgi:PhnB protein